MVRDKTKIYCEVNDPDTILSGSNLDNNAFLLGLKDGSKKRVVPFQEKGTFLIYTDNDGNMRYLKTEPNMYLGTNQSGELIWISMGG